MKERVTGEGMVILGGAWLLALWAHVALPGALPFALALSLLFAAAALLVGRVGNAAAAPGSDAIEGSPAGSHVPESAELGGLRAELRGLEAELHALRDRERTERAGSSVANLPRTPGTRGGAAA